MTKVNKLAQAAEMLRQKAVLRALDGEIAFSNAPDAKKIGDVGVDLEKSMDKNNKRDGGVDTKQAAVYEKMFDGKIDGNQAFEDLQTLKLAQIQMTFEAFTKVLGRLGRR